MLHAVMLDNHPLETRVDAIATFPVCHVDEGDFLFDAMISMTKQKMKRLMVCDGGNAVGMLDMTQILSVFSTHSHVLTLSIARATTIDELVLAANKQRQLVDSLLTNGIRTRFIMQLISAVNEQIIEKAFELIVPPASHPHICLIVLGSEGRGEQILKTDQDNALIIEDGFNWPDLNTTMAQLTHTLQQLGYPLCPGNVMVNNSDWVQSQSEWQKTVTHWINGTQPEHVMNIAIVADAHAIAGNKALLSPIKQHLIDSMKDQELILATFTRPALNFSIPLTLLGNVKASKQGVDLKAGGIFPLVHGVRALSLEHGLKANNTFERIDTLAKKQVLEKETAQNISEALKLFFKLRLAQQLSLQHSHNKIDLKLLDRTERDLLRHSLHVVKKFKQWLGYHYQIRD
jgi:CBS domain-containing protein